MALDWDPRVRNLARSLLRYVYGRGVPLCFLSDEQLAAERELVKAGAGKPRDLDNTSAGSSRREKGDDGRHSPFEDMDGDSDTSVPMPKEKKKAPKVRQKRTLLEWERQ